MTIHILTHIHRLKERPWLRIFAAVGIAVMVWEVEQHISVAITPSIDHRVFWRAEGAPEKGDYINFVLKHPLIHHGVPQRVTKKIMCVAGDRLVSDGKEIYCNGKLIAITKTTFTPSSRVKTFLWRGQIPFDRAFVLGNHRDSFDSRYWGFVDLTKTERLVAIF